MHVIQQQVNRFGHRVRHVVADTIGLETDLLGHFLASLFFLGQRMANHPARDTDHRRPFRHFLGNHRIGADLGILVHRKRPQHLGSRTNHHTVFQGRVALALAPAGATQGNAVIQGHVITDFCGFTDHHTHAVIDKETTANFGTGVNFNTGEPARKRG